MHDFQHETNMSANGADYLCDSFRPCLFFCLCAAEEFFTLAFKSGFFCCLSEGFLVFLGALVEVVDT